jgi:AcrR family transcriptional regulator
VRVKTDAKRREILATAWEVFRSKGYDGASMTDVAEGIGGSKATLYRYFQSKEQLFAAVLEDIIGEAAEATFARVAAEGDLQTRLLDFARTYLGARLSANSLAVERALVAEGNRSDLGEQLRSRFILPHWRRLAAAVDQEMQAGRLRRADPMLATWHLRGLMEVDIVERGLHGDRSITAHELETAATAGVDAFLRAYAP